MAFLLAYLLLLTSNFAHYSQNADGFYDYSYRRKKSLFDESFRWHVKICERVWIESGGCLAWFFTSEIAILRADKKLLRQNTQKNKA